MCAGETDKELDELSYLEYVQGLDLKATLEKCFSPSEYHHVTVTILVFSCIRDSGRMTQVYKTHS